MSIKDYSTKTVELCQDVNRLSTLGTSKAKTLFSLLISEKQTFRVLPKNIESVKDSFLLALVTYCAFLRKESFETTNEDIDRTHIVDCEWEIAQHYFQGVIRGISGIVNKKVFLTLPNKTPFHQGIWYVQSRLLRNANANNLALKIPKVQGLFNYTSTKGKGLTLSENISVAELVNSVIDALVAPDELWSVCTIGPDALKSQQVLKHKRPSSKEVIYYKGEIFHLTKNYDSKLDALDQPLQAAYKAVKDKASYLAYIDAIKVYNTSYSTITKLPDAIAALRYPVLFRKGIKGNQAVRLESLDLDDLNKICPVDWQGLPKPVIYNLSPAGIQEYIVNLKKLRDQVVGEGLPSAFDDWKTYVSKIPQVNRALNELGINIDGFKLMLKTPKPSQSVWTEDDKWGESDEEIEPLQAGRGRGKPAETTKSG